MLVSTFAAPRSVGGCVTKGAPVLLTGARGRPEADVWIALAGDESAFCIADEAGDPFIEGTDSPAGCVVRAELAKSVFDGALVVI